MEPDLDPVWLMKALNDYADSRVRVYFLDDKSRKVFGYTEPAPKGYWRRQLHIICSRYGLMVSKVYRLLRDGKNLPMWMGRSNMLDRYIALRLSGRVKI